MEFFPSRGIFSMIENDLDRIPTPGSPAREGGEVLNLPKRRGGLRNQTTPSTNQSLP
jgi:hypothetical protein